MDQITKDKFPADGGWKFRQPQFGPWEAKMSLVGYSAVVDEIQQARIRNKAISARHNLSTDREAIGNELIKFNSLRLGIPEAPAPAPFRQGSSQLPSRLVAAAADIKRAAQGTAVVLDWLTSGGKPVAQGIADKRAATCVACPKNVEGSWYTVAPAELIRSTLSARSDLKLATTHDEGLKSCDVCRCLNRLKVWCPMEHIVSKTKPEIMAEFPSNCWIAKRDA